MNCRQARNVARAVELDDAQPDDVCPGCKQDIVGWQRYRCHFPPGKRPRIPGDKKNHHTQVPWPWAEENNGQGGICPWSRDYLLARKFRRDYVRRLRVLT